MKRNVNPWCLPPPDCVGLPRATSFSVDLLAVPLALNELEGGSSQDNCCGGGVRGRRGDRVINK